jgi:hypothetical protein
LRREAHLDQRLLIRLEVDAAPLEREPPGRFPGGDPPDLERALVERFEEPAADAFLEVDLAAPAPGDAVGRALPPQRSISRVNTSKASGGATAT